MAAVEEKKTGADGVATFEIWPSMEYCIESRWQGKGNFHYGPLVRIPPGTDGVRLRVTLPTLLH